MDLRPCALKNIRATPLQPRASYYICKEAKAPSTLRRQPLCFLRPHGRKSVAVIRAAALYVSYVNLCSYVFRGKRLTQTLSYVLMSLCPYVSRVSGSWLSCTDAGRVAPISACVLCLRFVVARPLPYYKNFTCRVSYILH